MATLAEKAKVAASTVFITRVAAAMLVVAHEVLDAGDEDPMRVKLALSTVNSPAHGAQAFAQNVALDDMIADAETAAVGSATDKQIIDSVRSVWSRFAVAS